MFKIRFLRPILFFLIITFVFIGIVNFVSAQSCEETCTGDWEYRCEGADENGPSNCDWVCQETTNQCTLPPVPDTPWGSSCTHCPNYGGPVYDDGGTYCGVCDPDCDVAAGTCDECGCVFGGGGSTPTPTPTPTPPPPACSPLVGANATGGIISNITVGGDPYRVHTFTSDGTFDAPSNMCVEVLVVAGGGGGGGAGDEASLEDFGNNTGGGGGGGGGVSYSSGKGITAGSISVTVGLGGTQGTRSTIGGNGGNSQFGSYVSSNGGGGGGAGGASSSNDDDGADGGSGGGGAGNGNNGGNGTLYQGNNGGNQRTSYVGGIAGGGGGAGQSGYAGDASWLPCNYDSNCNRGRGGDGAAYSISGINTYYAGGGGGGTYTLNYNGGGGLGGGGNGGATNSGNGVAGTSNSGGGGGGAGNGSTNCPIGQCLGGSGGSGIVIIRYPYAPPANPTNITLTQPDYCTSGPAVTVNWNSSSQEKYQIQIDGASIGTPIDWVGPFAVDETYDPSTSTAYNTGQGKLVFNRAYKARVRVGNSFDWSGWTESPSWNTPEHAYPDPDFWILPDNSTIGAKVSMVEELPTFSSLSDPPVTWTWTFGEPGSPTVVQTDNAPPYARASTSFVYTQEGSWTVSLTAEDELGACTQQGVVTIKKEIPRWREVLPRGQGDND